MFQKIEKFLYFIFLVPSILTHHIEKNACIRENKIGYADLKILEKKVKLMLETRPKAGVGDFSLHSRLI